MNIKKIIFIKNGKTTAPRPYFLHKISNNKIEAEKIKRNYPGTKTFYLKVFNTRNGRTEYAIYLNKLVDRY